MANNTLGPRDEEIAFIEKHCAESARQLSRYQRLMDAIDQDKLTPELLDDCPELIKMNTEISKISYRIGILEQSIEEQKKINSEKGYDKECLSVESLDGENGVQIKKAKKEEKKNSEEGSDECESKPVLPKKSAPQGGGVVKQVERDYVKVENYCDSLRFLLNEIFAEAVRKAYPELHDVPITISETTTEKFGDYQFNSSMLIAQKLSKVGKKISPRDVATAVLSKVQTHNRIAKMEVAGPGYINVFLNNASIAKSVASIALNGVSIPKITKRRVVVDFSSPNIAKQMHVGHLRSTIIGEAICRLFEFVGFDVLRINHIGDWGTQFGMLIAHLYDRFPNFLKELPPIDDLQAFYKESKKRFDDDEEFKKRAYECVVKLQNFEPDFVKAWQMICDVSRKDFSRIYDRLDVTIIERGESFYHKLMPKIVSELEERGFIKNEDGRKLMFPTGCDIPLTVVKSDGGYTYDTSDLAALKYRLEVDKADWIIYVVDSGQSLHLETVFAAGRDLGWYNPEEKRVKHVAFGLVLGEDRKKFKTRSGDTVRLAELLDEGVKRATATLKEKERDKVMSQEELDAARDAVAYGCIRYADLSQTRTQDYVFSFDKMLDDRGNTAVYLLYAYARIRSICRNTGVTKTRLLEYVRDLPDGLLPLEHETELRLAKMIMKFSDCLLTILNSLMLHQLCDYVYALSTTFHDFYNSCYVIHKDREGNTTLYYGRLVLCEVTADVMASCFKILGLRTVEKM